jgi:hypothetical protein
LPMQALDQRDHIEIGGFHGCLSYATTTRPDTTRLTVNAW